MFNILDWSVIISSTFILFSGEVCFMARYRFWFLFAGSIIFTVIVLALLVSIFERKQQARVVFPQVVEVKHNEPDPSVWGKNFPREYETYMKTLTTMEMSEYSKYGRYGGSEAFSKLDKYPNYIRLFAGYPFSVEYREERGHLNALEDMLATKRLGDNKPGACVTCKSSDNPRVFEAIGEDKFYQTPAKELIATHGIEHSISCADCHEAGTMELRVTRPAFIRAMSERGIDISKASHQEMRSYVCGQCHVEYYWQKSDIKLTFPWINGFRIDDIEAYYDEIGFSDWTHQETGAAMVKIQHPEFELWSTGIHARSGVTCPDCHMPYMREGSIKLTDHWIQTPLATITRSCLQCHNQTESEMKSRVIEIQDRTFSLLNRSENAIIAAMDGIKLAIEAGAGDAELKRARELHRKAQIRWDFISAENSMGFHSGQEAVRMLGDSIDYARQAELEAYKVLVKRRPQPERAAR